PCLSSSCSGETMRIPSLTILLSALASAQTVTVPAGYDQVDAPSAGFVAGIHIRMREQYLFADALLRPLAGKTIAGITFRRDAGQASPLTGGLAQLEVSVSTAAARVEAPAPTFAANHGLDRTVVFTGPVTVPSSPAVPANPWDANATVSIQFQTAFPYAGGSLCVEVTGSPDPTRPAGYWPFDHVRQDPGGAVTSLGQAC